MKFKVCPKCRGDLYLREDTFGKFLSCMQCGYLKDLEAPQHDPNAAAISKGEKERDAA